MNYKQEISSTEKTKNNEDPKAKIEHTNEQNNTLKHNKTMNNNKKNCDLEKKNNHQNNLNINKNDNHQSINNDSINKNNEPLLPFTKKIDELKKEIILIKNQIINIKLRTQANAENIKKKSIKDINHIKNNRIITFIKELLPIIDEMNELTQNEKLKNNTIYKGLILTLQCLLNTMNKHGLQSEGKTKQLFDPKIHKTNSLSENIPNSKKRITHIEKIGYSFNNDIIRKAIVRLENET